MDRRDFLTAAGSAATLTLTGTLGRAAPADIYDLLDLLEETPRSQVIERVVARVHSGASYEDLLAALTLATVRNVQPYPDVGFKYHAVMVLQSIHFTGLGVPPAERWLPMLWAVDYFKEEQAEERHSSGWTMAARPSTLTPATSRARVRSALVDALDHWDLEAADAAVVNYASVAGPREVFELLWQYGARDWRGIGHKAITVQNAHRILALLGWQHRDPVLRSTVAALVNFYEDPNPATVDLNEDAAWRQNTALRREIPESWLQGRLDAAASADVLAALREGDTLETGRSVVGFLKDGISPMSIWNALHAAGAELLMTDPGVVPLHAQTTSNALHYAFRESADTATRQLMLMQGAAFIPRFRAMSSRARRGVTRMDEIEPLALEALAGTPVGSPYGTPVEAPAETVAAAGTDALDEVFSGGRNGRSQAIGRTLGYLEAGGAVQPLVDRVRHYLVANGTNSHHYKFAEAVIENHALMPRSPWRDRYLAAGFAYFNGPWNRANSTVREARELLKA